MSAEPLKYQRQPRRRRGGKGSLIGDVIREERLAANLTQVECARRFGVSLDVLRALEQGDENVTLDKVQAIARVFNLELLPRPPIISPEILEDAVPPPTEEILRRLGACMPILYSKFFVGRVSVFGSVAKGSQKKGSDIDIAVSYKNNLSAEEYFNNHVDLHLYLRSLFAGFKVDLVDLDKMKQEVKDSFVLECIDVEG